MDVLVIDAQGGGIGKQLVSGIKKKAPELNVVAVGSNSVATTAMKKAGADKAATGENSVVVCSKRARVITGPMGVVIADSMMGEITPAMAEAIGSSDAKRVLVPMSGCDTIVAGVSDKSVASLIEEAIEKIVDFFNEKV